MPQKGWRKVRLVLTADRLRELYAYDAETGLFTRKTTTCAQCRVGQVAYGVPSKKGYMMIRADGRKYPAHRLAWLYATDSWPTAQIDHINGMPGDNRLSNLREATASQNQANTRIRRCNRSGFKGITRTLYGKWTAKLVLNRKIVFQKNFETPEEAHAAYLAAQVAHHGDYARLACR